MSRDSVRRLAEQSPPVETGPVRFGDDKTGIFIRADNALGFATTLRNLLENNPRASLYLGSWKTQMENLLVLLESTPIEERDDKDAMAG